MIWNQETEKIIQKKVNKYLKNARETDMGHIPRSVEYAKYLLSKEGGDESIVLPAVYLHDCGWSMVKFDVENTSYNNLHMIYGMGIARRVLKEIDYDTDKVNKIIRIIGIHDSPDKVFDWNDLDAILVVEADRLDRYGVEAFPRLKDNGPFNSISEELEWLKEGSKNWFRTQTARNKVNELLDEMYKYIEENKIDVKIPCLLLPDQV